MKYLKLLSVYLIMSILVACGGGSSDSSSEPTITLVTPSDTQLSASDSSVITVSGKAAPGSTIVITFPDNSTQETTTHANGNYSLNSITPQNSGTILIVSNDGQGHSSDSVSENFEANLDSVVVLKALYKETGVMPELSFSPSLGINTEAPQGGVDTAGMPMPFVDIFRTARPFEEFEYRKDNDGNILSIVTNDIEVDSNGWPTKLNINTDSPGRSYTKTILLQGALKNSVPNGQYSLIFNGTNVKFEFYSSGSLSSFNKINDNKYTLDLSLKDIPPQESDETNQKYEERVANTNQIGFNILSNDSGTDINIKNIRIVMPGGTCTGNPYLRMQSQDDCPNGSTYESFSDRLTEDRNTIIFNPDYLLFLRNFKVIRMMNLMEASLKKLCYEPSNCPSHVGTSSHLATMNDAVWGGNDGRTPHEDHKGVPIEVMIELANTLQRDIWVNMPHVATDEYVQNYAEDVYDKLNSNLKVYLEYSNEVWNSGFAAYRYTSAQGLSTDGYDELPTDTSYDYQTKCDAFPYNTPEEIREKDGKRCEKYFARLRYFSKRSVEIFNIWESKFGTNNTRITRVLGSFIGDHLLTDFMIKHIESTFGANKVDAIAIAPYFFGCPYRIDEIVDGVERKYCDKAPKTLSEATTIDHIFNIIDQPSKDSMGNNIDVKGLAGTIDAVKNQLNIISGTNIDLITYEGGQHLVPSVMGEYVSDEDRTRLQKLFNEANRDPRMKDRYVTFLNEWKNLNEDGTTLFTLYTLPQSIYRYGNFGIKEHLNQTRTEAPKFDGAMSFQETHQQCWWDGCDP